MKKIYGLLFLALCLSLGVRAQEKLLYATDFQSWSALTSATEQVVAKTTDFSMEPLNFKLFQVTVNPTGRDETRFNYALVSDGWLQAQKVVGSYIELSPLASITKITFQHGATGSNRGYKVWKKNATDANWVLLSDAVANPAGGQEVIINVNEANVAIKFTNINETQNAYMFNLKIWGNYVSNVTQYPLNTSENIAGAGTITRTPNSNDYDAGSNVSLLATPNFGYHFVKWVDANSNADLSTNNPYVVTVDAQKDIKAIYEAVNTYTFTVNTAGSDWGQVQLSPLPTGGKYEEGTMVTMTVVPNAVTNFTFWEDNSTNPQRTVTVTADANYTANFDELPFIVGWNFKEQTPKQVRAGDFYSATDNTGLISEYEPNGTPVNWLSSLGSFSPAYPNIRLWTNGVDFLTTRRYIKAQFSTLGYTNIQVKSLVTANYQAYSVQKMQLSLDDINYVEIGSADITSVYNSTWANLDGLLPDSAENQPKVYIRWIADASSPILNAGTDNDGTAYTNIFVYADKLVGVDSIKPQLVSTVPVDGSATATINGSIVLTFDEAMKKGTGDITLNGMVLTPKIGVKTVTLPYEKLLYNTSYTLIVPAGALTDKSDNPFGDTTLSFTTSVRTEPVKKMFDAVVAQDGTGDYTSVIDAIAAAPTGRSIPWVIYIENGVYTGHHDIPASKPFIHLIGQTRDSVIISDNRLSGSDGLGSPVYHVSLGATMVVNSTDVYFENLTLENSHGYTKQAGPQALALYALTDRFAMNRCWLRSYQDTYLTAYNAITDRQYLKNCNVEGAVDFIYGGGDVFFDRCTITCDRKDGGYIVAPSHKVGTLWGYVFSNCTIEENKVSGVTTYFGRPWQNAPKTVFLNTTLKAKVYAVGWYYKMGAIPAIFADYNTMDANGNPVDMSQRISNYEYDEKDANGVVINTVHGTAKKSLTDAEAATYTYENVILRPGNPWDPRLIAEAPGKPENVRAGTNGIVWDTVPYTRLYIVFRNNKVAGFTLTPSFTDTASGLFNYTVQAVSEFGALSLLSDPAQILPLTGLTLKASKKANAVALVWSTASEANTSHFVVERMADNKFTTIGEATATGNSNSVSTYTFNDQAPIQGRNLYRIKAVDKDGKFAFSNQVAVTFVKDRLLQVSPVPAHDRLKVVHIEADGNSSLQLFTSNGQLVKTILPAEHAMSTSIDISGLAPGIYFISYKNGTQIQQTRFVKQ